MTCKMKNTDLTIINLPKALGYQLTRARTLFRPLVVENDAALPYSTYSFVRRQAHLREAVQLEQMRCASTASLITLSTHIPYTIPHT